MTHVSPEQAKELINGDFDTETRQEWAGSLQADFDNFSGAYINGTPGDFALADASVELAQTIADMKWEYTLTLSIDMGGSIEYEGYSPYAWNNLDAARMFVARQELPEGHQLHIMRRLVSAPEEVE